MREVRTFVRCGAQVVELTAGRPLTVGRAESCDIVLDDELASREHCRIELIGDEVEIVDLGSRNGLLVNGLPVDGRQPLHHGDLVTAGRSQLSLSRQLHRPRLESVEDEDGVSERPRTSSAADLTATGNVFDILGGSARRSLDDGDLPAAEQNARNLFVAIKSALARGRSLRDGILDDAIELGLRLASETREAGWIDRILELHVSAARTAAGPLVDRLIEAGRACGTRPRALDDYLAFARAADDPHADRLAAL